jgi:hypothetical protein
MTNRVFLISLILVVICFLFHFYVAVASNNCPETKVKLTQCGNVTVSTNNTSCIHFRCDGSAYGDNPPECTSRVQIISCAQNAPINEEDCSPEQTKTGVDTVAALIVCYTYYECKKQFTTNDCITYGSEVEHKVSPLRTFNCN